MNRVEQIANFIKIREGLYSNDPNDHGGETVRGITYGTYEHYCVLTKQTPRRDEFVQMSDDLWEDIFYEMFYRRCGADRILSPILAFAVTDFAWHSGPKMAVKLLQQAFNDELLSDIVEDGLIGPQTLMFVNRLQPINFRDVLYRYITLRGLYLDHLADGAGQSKWRGGWLARVIKLMDYAQTTKWEK